MTELRIRGGLAFCSLRSILPLFFVRPPLQLKQGKIGNNSYIPAGLSKAEYEKIRSRDQKAKDDNYKRNVAKAGKFEDYTEFYKKRGTDTSDAWIKGATRGHTMVKTKYDYSGSNDNKQLDQKV